MVSDVPLDEGMRLRIDWDVSTQDSLIDCYNIYRWEAEEPGAQYENYKYLTSAPRGVSCFIDSTVQYFRYYSYRISAAHHGYNQTIPYGNYGIWNDFSEPSEGGLMAPENNYYDFTLSFPTAQYDTLRMCPQGDLDTIRVVLTVRGSSGSPTENIPISDMCLVDLAQNPSYFCNEDHLHPISATNELGCAEFRFAPAGGCGSLSLQAIIRNRYASNELLAIAMRSPDLTSDGVVNLSDYAVWGPTMYKSCGQAGYNECADFWPPFCYINISDLVEFADHYNVCRCR